MALRSQTLIIVVGQAPWPAADPLVGPKQTISRLLTIVLMLTCIASAQSEFQFKVRHERALKTQPGELQIDAKGISFTETVKKKKNKPAHWEWPLAEIQQLKVSPESITEIGRASWRERVLRLV